MPWYEEMPDRYAEASLWDAVCALPTLPMGRSLPPLIRLERLHEHLRPDGRMSFSIYKTMDGVLALTAVPETLSFRLRYASDADPVAAVLLALVNREPVLRRAC
jgi:hypothetical protein